MKITEQKCTLKNGEACVLRSPEAADAKQMIAYLTELPHTTDYMLRYPEEADFDLLEEQQMLERMGNDPLAAFIACFSGDRIIGNVGLYPVLQYKKMRHRCEIGIGVCAAYRGQGVGSILLEQAIAYAKSLGYEQMELDVVSENKAALALYQKFGFQKVGQIPHGMKRKEGGYYDLDYMVCSL